MTNHNLQLAIEPDRESPSPGEAVFWGEPSGQPGVVREENGRARHPFDLEERTSDFGRAIVRFARMIPPSPVNNRLIDQLVGAGTSVGANYAEADDSVSPRDFLHRIAICRKEARETKFFLRMIVESEPGLSSGGRPRSCTSSFPPFGATGAGRSAARARASRHRKRRNEVVRAASIRDSDFVILENQ